jgi:hypothetical protein
MNILADSKNIITNKANLYTNFKKYYPNECNQYMAASWQLKDFIKNASLVDRIKSKKDVFIIRPAGIGAFSGKDIFVVYNDITLKNAIENTRKYNNVLISEYITNPLLFENKKFHVRIYFLVSIINNKLNSRIFDFYEIFTAEKPYKNSDWLNKDIHDTHARGNDEELIFPMDNKDLKLKNAFTNTYIPKIKNCLKLVSKFIDGQVKPYPQAENAFEIFGCDFLIKDNGDIVLMEINDKVGYKCQTTKTTIRLSKCYFNTIIKDIFEQLL